MRISDEGIVRFAAPRLQRALRAEDLKISNRAYRYLVGIVAFSVTNASLQESAVQQPLASRYQRGLEYPVGTPEREIFLGAVGDLGLLICAFWWHQGGHRGRELDIKYTIEIGRHAYSHLETDPYPELTDKYARLAQVMALFGIVYAGQSRDVWIGQLYEFWTRSGSRMALRQLTKLGVDVSFRSSNTPS
jgi:hypothetical protein